jgi:uncharacterized protein YoaH (UPF0181 family)
MSLGLEAIQLVAKQITAAAKKRATAQILFVSETT